MVYIDRNGRVCETRPWDMGRVMEIFSGFWFFCVQFFRTLFAPFQQAMNERSERNRNNGSGGGWGPGGGGGGGRGFGGGSGGRGFGSGGGGPERRLGRIRNTMDCNIPSGG